jgi:hypothetical protein
MYDFEGYTLMVKQLVLQSGNYTVYSDEVWNELETCPGYDFQSASRVLSWVEIGGIIASVMVFIIICLFVLLWVFRKKLFPKKYAEGVTSSLTKISIDQP